MFLLFVILSGIMSGFSLLVAGGTLNFWMLKMGLDKSLLGALGLVMIPYSVNFLWAPIFDYLNIVKKSCFGVSANVLSKITWLIVMTIGLSGSIIVLSLQEGDFYRMGVIAFFVAFFSSSKDALLGAIRVNLMTEKQIYHYSGFYLASYRIGMFISSSIAIYFSEYCSWGKIYFCFGILALVLGFSIAFIYFLTAKRKQGEALISQNIDLEENEESGGHFHNNPESFLDKIKKILSIFSKGTLILLLFLALYKFPDNLVLIMINAFLLEQGYTNQEIAIWSKTLGMVGAIIGGIISSYVMNKHQNIKKHLLQYGLLHIISHIFLAFQAYMGKNLMLLKIGVLLSSVTGGIAMSVYMALITLNSSGRYKATKYAFYTSIMGLSRTFFPLVSGLLISYLSWTEYFLACAILGLPALVLIRFLK